MESIRNLVNRKKIKIQSKHNTSGRTLRAQSWNAYKLFIKIIVILQCYLLCAVIIIINNVTMQLMVKGR